MRHTGILAVLNMPPWIRWVAVAALFLFAIYVRFDSLDSGVYWYDEAITALRVAGHSEREVFDYASAHPVSTLGDFQRFTQVNTSTSTTDTIRSLALEDSQHVPLYYVAARGWAYLFGSSLAAGRGLAAFISLLVLPAMYWLCLELFVMTGVVQSRAVCWVGVAAMAISPYQVAIAREHREYSLWVLLIIAGCAAFLRAVRTNDIRWWALYAAAMTLGLYTHLLTALVILVIGIWLIVRSLIEHRGVRFTRPVMSFLASSLVAGILILPWIARLVAGRTTAQDSLSWVQNFTQGRFNFLFSLHPASRVADLSIWGLADLLKETYIGFGVGTFLTIFPILVLLALWNFTKGAALASTGFTLALICSASLTLFLVDFYTGSTSGWAHRYSAPTSLGWTLAMAFLAVSLINLTGRTRALGLAILSVCFIGAIISSLSIHSARLTWTKGYYDKGELVDFLNSEPNIELASDAFVGDMLVLTGAVRSDLEVSWYPRCFSCSRSLTPFVELPPAPSGKHQLIYFRAWINKLSTPVIMALADDSFGNPKYHTHSIGLPGPSINIFLLRPRTPTAAAIVP